MESKTELTKKVLRCLLSPEEKEIYSKKLASKTIELLNVEADKKTVVSDFSFRINGLKAEVQNISQKIDSGHELREVECTIIYNYEAGVFGCSRNNTGEVIETRKMTTEELQGNLF